VVVVVVVVLVPVFVPRGHPRRLPPVVPVRVSASLLGLPCRRHVEDVAAERAGVAAAPGISDGGSSSSADFLLHRVDNVG